MLEGFILTNYWHTMKAKMGTAQSSAGPAGASTHPPTVAARRAHAPYPSHPFLK
jgi:hypothetical protein